MRAVLDLDAWQPSFSIVNFLMAVEHERVRRGARHVDVEVMAGSHDGFGKYRRYPQRLVDCQVYMANIVRPAIGMLRSVGDYAQVPRRELDPEVYAPRKQSSRAWLAAYAAGIRPLHNNEVGAHRNGNLVTLTLRECGPEHWPVRNNDLARWTSAARLLRTAGYYVIVVRDTARADEPLEDLATEPRASVNLIMRAWLYASAAANVFVSNGPAWFALSLDVPVLMFRPTCDEANKASHSSSMAKEGLPIGGQLVGAPDYQRLCWEDDTPETIVRETIKLVEAVNAVS